MSAFRCETYQPSANPRTRGCERCGLLPKHHAKPASRARNPTVERELSALAAQAAGYVDAEGNGDTMGLDAYSESRAWPSGVRLGEDWRQHFIEEVADARSYACWRLEELRPAFQAGDAGAAEEYQRMLRALSHVVAAWAALVGR